MFIGAAGRTERGNRFFARPGCQHFSRLELFLMAARLHVVRAACREPPQHLGERGRALYQAVLTDYEIGDAAGLALLTTACEALDRMREAQDEIAAHGAVIQPGRRGGIPRANPAVRIEHDATVRFMAAMRALRLDVEPPKER
jgi:P27 family predicted phage terminase small subunit